MFQTKNQLRARNAFLYEWIEELEAEVSQLREALTGEPDQDENYWLAIFASEEDA